MLRDLKLALRTIQNWKCADSDVVVAEYFTLSDNGELKHSTYRIRAMIKLPEDPLGNYGSKLFLHLFTMLPKTGDKNCKLAAERDTEDH